MSDEHHTSFVDDDSIHHSEFTQEKIQTTENISNQDEVECLVAVESKSPEVVLNEEDSINIPLSATLNSDIFDAEYDDDIDLLPLPGPVDYTTYKDDDDKDEKSLVDAKLKSILMKGASKRESTTRKSKNRNRKDDLMGIHSVTQKIVRESRVRLPYHNPEKQGLSSVLERIKHKREIFGVSSKKSSLPWKSRTISSEPISLSSIIPPAPIPSFSSKDGSSVRTRLNFGDSDEEFQNCEGLMSRLTKKMNEKEIDLIGKHEEGIEDSITTRPDDFAEKQESNVKVHSENVDPSERIPDVSVTTGKPTEIASDSRVSKIQDLLKNSIDLSVVPQLGRRGVGDDDDLIIVRKEKTGLEELFMRLEKEFNNNNNKNKEEKSVEMCTATKQTVGGLEVFEMKTIVYDMDEKQQVETSTRDHLKSTLKARMIESREGRMLERYEEYKRLNMDKNITRLAEDIPQLPDDDDDCGGDDSSCSRSSSDDDDDEAILEDEEEEAVKRHEQANPFIDEEAADDDNDDDDVCAVEGDDDDDNEDDEVKDGDDDHDDEIGMVKRKVLKIIEDDDDDDDDDGINTSESTTRNHDQDGLDDDDDNGDDDDDNGDDDDDGEKHIGVNLFNEDAISCQRLVNERNVPARPFEDFGNVSDDSSFSSILRATRDSTGIPTSSKNRIRFEDSSSNSQVNKRSINHDDDDLSQFTDKLESTSQPMMSSQESDSDWLLNNNNNDDQSISQVIRNICSSQKPQNNELIMFCSGNFAAQQDGQPIDKERSSMKRKHDDDDDDDGDDDDLSQEKDDIEEDDDEELIQGRYLPMKRKGKINEEFVEEEAELSGSEDEDDDDEDGGRNDEMEVEEGDDDDVGTEEELKKQVHRVHLKTMIDQDKREIRLLQEHLLEDGDLHDDDGVGRMRRFRWHNIDANDEGNDCDTGDVSDDNDFKEGEDEAKWRIMRIERQKFLQKCQDVEEDNIIQNNSQTPQTSKQMKLKLVSSFVQDSPTSNNISFYKGQNSTPQTKLPNFMSNSAGPKPFGSFLTKSKDTLSKFSDATKAGIPTHDNSTKTIVSRNSRNFVFAHISPSKKHSNENNKTSGSGIPPRKKPHLEAPLPPSRILKYLNE